MSVDSEFVPVCALGDLADLSARSVVVDGAPICLVRVSDEVFAVDDICSHAEVALSDGIVDGDATISCWLHGSKFDLRTGEPDEPPAWEPVATFKTRITDNAGVPTVEVSRQPHQENA